MAYQRILVAADSSPASQCALEEAIRLAREQNAQLRIIHVIDNQTLYLPDGIAGFQVEEGLRKAGEWLLAQAEAAARQQGIACETAMLESVEKPIAMQIIEDGKKWGANLIVLGTHGRHGFDRFLLGSVAERVARRAFAPVLLIHAQAGDDHERAAAT